MGKKSKRRTAARSSSPMVTLPSAPTSSSPRAPEFNPDYSYVTHDLRRIGMIAGSFIVILIALAFVLR